MPLVARLLNVFAIPAEVFEEVKASRPRVANWLLPACLSMVAAVLTTLVLVSQPAMQKQLREASEQQVKAIEEQVKQGKLKQDFLVKLVGQDKVVAATRVLAAPVTAKTLAASGAAFAGLLRVFWWGFVLWLLGRIFLKVAVPYLKALEVAGLALMISLLGTGVLLLLMLNVPRLLATSSLAMASTDFDPAKGSFLLAAADKVFSLWFIGVLSVGLARLADVPFLRAAWFVFGIWLIQQALLGLLVGGLMRVGM